MAKTLILTGWGWNEYPVAAAVALKVTEGDADVFGMSRRRLPEFLESYAEKHKRIVLIGIGLGGDEPSLATALSSLKRRGIDVTWISALDFTSAQKESFSSLLIAKIRPSGTLLEAVGHAYGVGIDQYIPYAVESRKATVAVRAWHELIDASMYAYRNYQDEKSYTKAIRYLACGVSESAWDVDARRAENAVTHLGFANEE